MDAEQDMPGGFSLPSWRPTLPPSAAWDTPRACWWLLLPEPPGPEGIGARLKQRLEGAGQRVILLTPGPRLAQLGEHHWSLQPTEAADYDLLLRLLLPQGLAPDRVLHLWSLLPPGSSGELEAAFEPAQEGGFQSLMFLLQALGRQAPRPLSLVVLTHRMQALGEETPCPERATVLGAVRAASRESPHVACRSVDVNLPAPGSWQEARLAGWLLSECAAASSGEDVVYRGQQRHVRAFAPIDFPEATQSSARVPGPLSPRERGVYLVLGGFGTLGSSHAEALARHARARLVLVSRSLMPERTLWEDWLATHDASDPLSRRIHQVRALEALGSEVRVISADVGDRDQLRTALDETLAHFGALHGVVFCVGAMNPSLSRSLADLTQEDVRVLFQSRVRGLYALEEVLRGRPLDFCLIASSLAAVYGRGASAAYAAAMNFVDAFALRQAQRSPVPWVSVDWDGWAGDADAFASTVGPLGSRPITAAEGAELFTGVLSLGGVARVAVTPRDPSASATPQPPPRPPEHGTPRAEPAASDPSTARKASRPALETAYVAPRDAVEESIAKVWESMLGITGVGIYDNFFELGGDWRTGMTVMTQVREKTGVPLPPVSLQEGPTVELLAQRLRAASEGLPDKSFDRPLVPSSTVKPSGEED
ncbi:SDR family oxidoreductase [Cystobacter fuscus]|uniref:SDR family NAD(P)-dependent oxidoreductase n=1 Tax=Cystobacter fuscus TaxID=43 RepID=UPI002B2D60F2|nr:SDR family oxidoreductase [Cystobacter fuscus]